jgi:predicted lipoprotein with Yx(FWY)xxD motif
MQHPNRTRFDRAWLIAGVLAFGILAFDIGAALAQSAPATSADTAKGKALVNGDGMTLYTFDNDSKGKSNCNGACANLWLPLIATVDASAAGDFSLITRGDGRKQWAYKNKPLYSWSKDTKPGDTTGDGVNSVWHIATP